MALRLALLTTGEGVGKEAYGPYFASAMNPSLVRTKVSRYVLGRNALPVTIIEL